jgi:hypothetical protein
LACSDAISPARWTASCALTVNLSQRIGISLLRRLYECKQIGEFGSDPFSPFRFRYCLSDAPN